MSDYIDELVAEWSPGFLVPSDLPRFARAVAERVRERARVCPGCAGVGRYFDKRRKIRDCDRCAGRGVTFGGEA